jgi:alpha-1,3-rhamnosyl/mannosyltransferase
MRIIFNGLATLKPKTGVGHYASNLLAELRALTAAGEIVNFPDGWLKRAVRTGQHILAGRRGGGGGPGGPVSLGLRLKRAAGRVARSVGRGCFQGSFRFACRRTPFDLYHEPNFIPWDSDVPTVVTVHDLSVVRHPEWHPADRVDYHERHFRRGLGRCAHFLTVSEFSRRELSRLGGVAPERVTAVHNGVGDRFAPLPPERVAAELRRLGLPERYVLSVGTIEPRKNLLTLLRAYVALPAGLRSRYPLLLVGGWGWNAGPVRDYLERTARPAGVVHLGYLSDDELPAVYNGARALAYPSFYEGFGLPTLEMMACGGAVLASTAEAHREVLPPGAPLIDPHDDDAWRAALGRVLTDDEWWAGLRAGAAGYARRYSWRRSARETLAVYRRLAA